MVINNAENVVSGDYYDISGDQVQGDKVGGDQVKINRADSSQQGIGDQVNGDQIKINQSGKAASKRFSIKDTGDNQDVKVCPECGKSVSILDDFCDGCGKRF